MIPLEYPLILKLVYSFILRAKMLLERAWLALLGLGVYLVSRSIYRLFSTHYGESLVLGWWRLPMVLSSITIAC